MSLTLAPNGWRYPRVGGTRQRYFAGTNFKPHKLPENAATPTRRVHAVLAGPFTWIPKLIIISPDLYEVEFWTLRLPEGHQAAPEELSVP